MWRKKRKSSLEKTGRVILRKMERPKRTPVDIGGVWVEIGHGWTGNMMCEKSMPCPTEWKW